MLPGYLLVKPGAKIKVDCTSVFFINRNGQVVEVAPDRPPKILGTPAHPDALDVGGKDFDELPSSFFIAPLEGKK